MKVCILGKVSPTRTSTSAKPASTTKAPRPTSNGSPRMPATLGSKLRDGTDTQWKPVLLHVWLSPTPRRCRARKNSSDRALAQAGVPVEALFSTLGRTLCRGLEAKMCAQLMLEYVDELEANIKAGDEVAANMDKWEPSTWPKECKGVGQCEAPRGALGHWCVIKDGVIENWQAVVPTTWNASPRDTKGQLGAYEAALLGTPGCRG